MSAFYRNFKEYLGEGLIDFESYDVYATLVTSAYSHSTGHSLFSDITESAIIGTAVLQNTTWNLGQYACDGGALFSSPEGGLTVAGAVFWYGGLIDTTKYLICFIDQLAADSLITDGTDITLDFSERQGLVFSI